MAYDPDIGKLVLFGGEAIEPSNLSRPFNDTWTYDGATWIQQHPATSPPPRAGNPPGATGGMAYDPSIGRLVLVHMTETWTFDGKTWTKESPAVSPVGWSYSPVTYDAALKKLVLYTVSAPYKPNPTTWIYDGKTWISQSSPTNPPQGTASMAYDPAVGHTVLFGGNVPVPNNYRDPGTKPVNDTWIYDGETWTKQSPLTAPTPRAAALMVYDPAHNSLVLYGGQGLTSSDAPFTDTWTYGTS
jgi:hypothetical protein